MKEKKSSSLLLKRRSTLLARLSTWDSLLLRGSLIERYKRCGKPGCKCANDRGHGPKYYLSVSHSKTRPEMDYVPQELQAKVEKSLHNFQLLKEVIEEICSINQELLRRREEF